MCRAPLSGVPDRKPYARTAPSQPVWKKSVMCRARLSGVPGLCAAGRLPPVPFALVLPAAAPPLSSAHPGSVSGSGSAHASAAFSLPARGFCAPSRTSANVSSFSRSRRPISAQRRSARTAASMSQNLTVRRLHRRACAHAHQYLNAVHSLGPRGAPCTRPSQCRRTPPCDACSGALQTRR